MTTREAILGRGLFDVFPDNPDDPEASGVRNLKTSLDRVLQLRVSDAMAVQKYDIRRPDAEGGGFEERFWSPVNTPVFDEHHELAYIIHRVEDVTEFLRLKHADRERDKMTEPLREKADRMEVEIYVRAQQVSEANRQLSIANAKLAQLMVETKVADTQKRQLIDELNERHQRLKRVTRELEDTNRELEAFSYSVSHDLRAPLRHIDGFSQMLIDAWPAGLDAAAREHLDRVRSAAARMAELVDDLLRLSQVGRADMHRQRVDISALARTVARGLDRADPSRQVRWRIAEGLTAEGDQRLLHIVLENLIGNAWKFTSHVATAEIEVGSCELDDRPAWFIRDNGAGFDARYAARLFAPFQRLHSESEFPGTGIGLATVQRIIRRHGGRIVAEGAVSKGATFRWTLDGA